VRPSLGESEAGLNAAGYKYHSLDAEPGPPPLSGPWNGSGLFSTLSRALLVLSALLLLPGAAVRAAEATAPAGVTLERGEIGGAKFAIARPAHWNGSVLLLAHGLRELDAPLVADLNPAQPACRTLLDEGWVVASTSYRRNGMIIRDAIADLDNLRAHIAATSGQPRRVILEGDAMGGAIVTLMAEQPADHYQGAVAVGVTLQANDPDNSIAYNLQPQIPLIFLCNQNELAGPRKYVAAPFDRPVSPIVLQVARGGHVNINQRERLVALRTLLNLIDREPVNLPKVEGIPACFDATQEPEPGPSQVRTLNEGGFEARVTEVLRDSGNLVLNAQPADFERADIAPGTWFELVAGGRTYRIFYGRDLGSVPRGGWVGFSDADGFLCLARNHDRAAATAALLAGDPVVIHRVSAEAAPESSAAAP
jgi:pimeloyl-ACP methyl ester carboxylesterase